MANETRYRMSSERKAELENELHILHTEKELQVAEQLKEARSFGDLSENSEYDEAKSEQAKLYARIAELTDLIENAIIVEATNDAFRVGIGSIVTVKNLDYDEEETYRIVGSQEANPMEGRISDDSPFGRALFGKSEGDKVAVHAPGGDEHFVILNIEKD